MTPKGKPLFGKQPSAKRPPGAVAKLCPSDKRRSERHTTFKNGKIILRDRSVIDCIVRNDSEHGCLVTAIGAESLPDEVMIQLDMLSGHRPARVAWRDQGVAGLEFLGQAKSEASRANDAARERRLRAIREKLLDNTND